MKKGLFSGWKEVFNFTFKQGVEVKGFKGATIGIGILLFAITFALNGILAYVQKKDATTVSPIEKVWVLDESNLDVLFLDGFAANKEKFPSVTFENTDKTLEEARSMVKGVETPNDVVLHISTTDSGYMLDLLIPSGSMIAEDQGEDLLEAFGIVMEQSKIMSSDISADKLVLAMSGVQTVQLNAGEKEKSIGEELVTMLGPMFIVLLVYIMVIVYGQSAANAVSIEKTSKLMEMILTFTKPYGLILGKILATVCLAISQTFIWVVAAVAGFFVGDIVAETVIYNDYVNVVLEVFNVLSSQEGSTAFGAGALILAGITVCLAFLFYCVIAGFTASFATKAEELAQSNGYFMMVVLVGFMGSYLLPMQGNEFINTILRIFPVTSAFLLPGDLLVGNVNVGLGVLYVALLLVFTLSMVVATGIVYKNQLFFRGTGFLARLKNKMKK